jgi:hypothetical protein
VVRRVVTALAAFGCAALLGAPGALAAGPPQIPTSWVQGVTASTAALKAEINANGLQTKYFFEYITEAAYEANLKASLDGFAGAARTPVAPKEVELGSSEVLTIVSLQAAPLVPATFYRYRAQAKNSAGEITGPERAFRSNGIGTPFSLPDDRAWEMVSPVEKSGGAIAPPGALFGGGDFQAAAAMPAITYGSATAFGDAPGAPPGSQYVSRRTPSGWITENVSAPLESGAYGDEPDGVPYRLFSTDLARSLLFGGLPCRGGLPGCPAPNPVLPGSGAPAGYMAYYLRDAATGAFSSLLGAADVAHSAVSPPNFEVDFAAATPDLSHLALSSCAALTPNAPEVPDGSEDCDPDATNLYARSAAGLSLVNLLPGEAEGTPGAEIAAPLGAISGDGARVYWVHGGNLYLRQGGATVQVDEAVGGGGAFEVASADGSVAFFSKAGHLYRFLAATKAVTDLTPAGGVAGVLGAGADGGRVYYQDAGGLRLWHAGATTTVAPGADVAAASSHPPATGTARVSPDGLHLAFLSVKALTLFDNLDDKTGQPDLELYLYGPPPAGGAASLICASCNPSGERPEGSASVPGAQVNGSTRAYKPRVLSADGSRLFFDSDDDLSEKDTNAAVDVYQWEAQGVGSCTRSPGCVNLISSGRERAGATFIDASADGSDVFFLTIESLVKADPGSIDLYDARAGGGLPQAPEPIPCVADACQALPGEPDDPTPGTLVPTSGNPPLRFFGPKRRKPAKKRAGRGRHRSDKGGKGRNRGNRSQRGRR